MVQVYDTDEPIARTPFPPSGDIADLGTYERLRVFRAPSCQSGDQMVLSSVRTTDYIHTVNNELLTDLASTRIGPDEVFSVLHR